MLGSFGGLFFEGVNVQIILRTSRCKLLFQASYELNSMPCLVIQLDHASGVILTEDFFLRHFQTSLTMRTAPKMTTRKGPRRPKAKKKARMATNLRPRRTLSRSVSIGSFSDTVFVSLLSVPYLFNCRSCKEHVDGPS